MQATAVTGLAMPPDGLGPLLVTGIAWTLLAVGMVLVLRQRPWSVAARLPGRVAAVFALAIAGGGLADAPALGSVARHAEPVVLTGERLPEWSRRAGVGIPREHVGVSLGPADGPRDAHHGTVLIPPDSRSGVPVEHIAAFRWTGARFSEIPVQVDERFPFFLINHRAPGGSATRVDQELTYAWDVEGWSRTAGECTADHPAGVAAAVPDPVAGLDDDDEVVFMASDAGSRAPAGASPPIGTLGARMEVALRDPLGQRPVRYVYLFRRSASATPAPVGHYVDFRRAADADQWIDNAVLPDGHPERVGGSNTIFGPNLTGPVCETAADGTVTRRQSPDRFPRDGHTVVTPAYRMAASGRWMLRSLQVATAGSKPGYGPDLIDRWKGRAFQQSPDSVLAGADEDEQDNWEGNSTVLGWRTGPVRAIREVWGADSGVNLTRTETYYREGIVHRYRLRVHPIAPDAIYTSWDYNRDVAARYFSPRLPDGAAIDGVNDDRGHVDGVGGVASVYLDAPDPDMNAVRASDGWDQVSGRADSGSLVYAFEFNDRRSEANGITAFSFYRDDACFDDGTGDDPVPRPYTTLPGTHQKTQAAYAEAAGKPYEELRCEDKQGAHGTHGIHVQLLADTDNGNVVDAQQWQFAVPTAQPRNVGERYAAIVRAPLRTEITGQPAPLPVP